jgi:hypothetical protein
MKELNYNINTQNKRIEQQDERIEQLAQKFEWYFLDAGQNDYDNSCNYDDPDEVSDLINPAFDNDSSSEPPQKRQKTGEQSVIFLT